LAQLNEINWSAVQANRWSGSGIASSVKEGKQAKFLVETGFTWDLVEYIGVCTDATYDRVAHALTASDHKPRLEIKTDWYY